MRVAQAQNAPNAQQRAFRNTYEPIVKAELSFAIRAAGLKGVARQKAIAAGAKWFDWYVKTAAKGQMPGVNVQRVVNQNGVIQIVNGPMVVRNGRVIRNRTADVPKIIADGVYRAVKKGLTNSQSARYTLEKRARDEFREAAAIAKVVATVDERVTLSEVQREALSEELAKQWQQIGAPQPETLVQMSNYPVSIPKDIAEKCLSKQQLDVWNSETKQSVTRVLNVRGMMAFGTNQVIGDVQLPPAGQ